MKLRSIILHTCQKLMNQFAVFSIVTILCWGLLAARFSLNTESDNFSVDAVTDSLLCIAQRLEGTPYRYGGKNENGFDCSGYTRYLYQQVGINLNASAATQYTQGTAIHADSLRQGDLLFFQHADGRIFHVGLYLGKQDEQAHFIHASSSRGVVVDALGHSYFRKRWAGTRRIFSG